PGGGRPAAAREPVRAIGREEPRRAAADRHRPRGAAHPHRRDRADPADRRMRPRHLAWIALALWVGAAVLLIPLAGKAGSVESTDPSLDLPRQAGATRAMLRDRQAFPGPDTPVPVVVY